MQDIHNYKEKQLLLWWNGPHTIVLRSWRDPPPPTPWSFYSFSGVWTFPNEAHFIKSPITFFHHSTEEGWFSEKNPNRISVFREWSENMAVGLREFARRTGNGSGTPPVLDESNGEELMHVQPSVAVALGNRSLESPGTLYITSRWSW